MGINCTESLISRLHINMAEGCGDLSSKIDVWVRRIARILIEPLIRRLLLTFGCSAPWISMSWNIFCLKNGILVFLNFKCTSYVPTILITRWTQSIACHTDTNLYMIKCMKVWRPSSHLITSGASSLAKLLFSYKVDKIFAFSKSRMLQIIWRQLMFRIRRCGIYCGETLTRNYYGFCFYNL